MADDGSGGQQQRLPGGEVTDLRCGACGGMTQHLVPRQNPNGVEEWYCPPCYLSWTREEFDPKTRRFKPRIAVVPEPAGEPV